jgi:uncharacterized protein DUF4238
MNKSVPKHQHFVSQMLIRRFADQDGKLYFFSKRFPDKGVLRTTPEKLFHERHLYTVEDKDGVKDVTLELIYAELESRADPVIEKIVTSARNGRMPHLTREEKQIWDDFFYIQWKRVPDFHGKFTADENFRRLLEGERAKLKEMGRLTPDEEHKFEDPAWIERVKQNAKVDSLARMSPRVRAILSDKGLVIAITRKSTKSFVMGSFPVVKLAFPGREHLADPTVEVWLPVAHDVAVCPAPVQPTREKLVEIHDHQVRVINVAVFKQSTAIAGRSRELIASLSHSH